MTGTPDGETVRLDQQGTIAGDYLIEATIALQRACDTGNLYDADVIAQLGLSAEEDLRPYAEKERARHLVNCVLFTSLAAEAYINAALRTTLGGKDFDAIDKLPPLEKYVLGTALAFGQEYAIDRGNQAYEALEKLFKLRNLLVHPKRGTHLGTVSEPNRSFTERFSVTDCVNYIGVTALAGAKYMALAGARDSIAETLFYGRAVLEDLVVRRHALPGPDDPPEEGTSIFKQCFALALEEVNRQK